MIGYCIILPAEAIIRTNDDLRGKQAGGRRRVGRSKNRRRVTE